jgi:hypothetical protein
MSLYAIEGDVGGGKSFVAVNYLMARYLWETRRPIYTNLPCDGDELEFYLAWLARSPVVREQYRQRLHFLQPGEQEAFEPYWADVFWVRTDGSRVPDDCVPRSKAGQEKAIKRRGWRQAEKEIPWPDKQELEEDYRRAGYRLFKRSLGKRDRVREFWWFTEPNAVIFLDESADIWNALSKDRPASLQSYINHHRHYKDDLYFFMQARDDLDVQVRRKIRTLYYIENMKNQNMFDWWALRGLRWPVQHFRVREFHGRKVLGKGGDFDRFEPINAWKAWPTRRRFKNYRSFSAAATLPGKRLPAEGAQSTDLDTPWQRIRGWLGGAWAPLSVLTFIVVAFVMGLRFMYALADVNSADVAKHLTGSKTNLQSKSSSSRLTPALSLNHASTNGTNGITLESPEKPAKPSTSKDPERLLFAGPEYFKTTRRTVRVGERLGARRIARILFDGVEFDDGQRVHFEALLL